MVTLLKICISVWIMVHGVGAEIWSVLVWGEGVEGVMMCEVSDELNSVYG